MRHMSFALTTDQIRRQRKTVTRRLGWAFLKPGDLLQPIVKGQGLKKGETVEKIGGPIRVVNVSRAPLNSITPQDVFREGFPAMTQAEFVKMFKQSRLPRGHRRDAHRIRVHHVKVKVTGSCEMFASFDMVCPLCQVTIPANTPHSCSRPQ